MDQILLQPDGLSMENVLLFTTGHRPTGGSTNFYHIASALVTLQVPCHLYDALDIMNAEKTHTHHHNDNRTFHYTININTVTSSFINTIAKYTCLSCLPFPGLFDTLLGLEQFFFSLLYLCRVTVIFRTKRKHNNISEKPRFCVCIANCQI